MQLPSESSPVVDSLRNSLIACATFQALVGADNAAEATVFVHDGFLLDEEDEYGTEATPFPRAILDDNDPERWEVQGPSNLEGNGRLGIYIQFLQFTDAELEDWYDGEAGFTSGGTAGLKEHRLHCRNLYRRISRELGEVARTPGCLMIDRLIARGFGLENPKTNNNQKIWAMEWEVEWGGLP